MATTLLTAPPTSSVTLLDTPTLGHMHAWWQALQHDPARHYYTDFMPDDLEEFLLPVQQGQTHVAMFLVRDDVGGVYYLHDWGTDSDGPYAWLGTYILPAYRGRLAVQAFHAIRQRWHTRGWSRLFAAIREQNRAAQCLITRHFGFTRLGRYPHWSYFEGHLDHVILYTLRPEDHTLAWRVAAQRAARFRQGPPPRRQKGQHLTV